MQADRATGRQTGGHTDRQADRRKDEVNTCRAHIAVIGSLCRGVDSGPWVWAIVPVNSILFAREAVGKEIVRDHDTAAQDMDRDGKRLALHKLPDVIALIPDTRPERTIVDVLIVIVVPVQLALAPCR